MQAFCVLKKTQRNHCFMTNFTSRQLRNFQYARNIAEMSSARQRVGAVVVQGKKVLSARHNSERSHPLQAKYDKLRDFNPGSNPKHSVHAEINCLAPLIGDPDIDWARAEVYVYRLRRDQSYGMARPCPACMQLLKDCGIRHLFYTTDDGFAYERIDTNSA